MKVTVLLLAATVGYLLGSVSFARVVGKYLAPAEDVTALSVEHEGTTERTPVEAIGANAAAMLLGPKWGGIVVLLDMLKAALPTLIYRITYPDQPYYLIVAVAALAGHNWPIFHGFRGGRGFSAILGGLVVVDWLGAVVTILTSLFLGMALIGSVPLAYVGWLFLLIPWMWFRTHDPVHVGYVFALISLFLLATAPELRTVWRYRREGRLDAYMQGMMRSSPRWRGMQRLAERLRLWRR